MRGEFERLEGSKQTLIPTYKTEADNGSATKDVPQVDSPEDKKARESVERFQKLCRDARRKAIGG